MSLDAEHKEFARLIARHQGEVQSYIFANVPRWADADEIWQETSVRLWLEFEKYQQGTNFAGWAIRVAYFEVLTWRKKVSRSRIVFDQTFVDALAAEQDLFSSEHSRTRLKALDECLKELTERKREVLARFYKPRMRVEEIAEAMKCTVDSVYKRVQRIRRSLRHCIELRMEKEEPA